MKKFFIGIWDFLVAWGETMDAYRKSQGRNFNNHI